MTTLKYKGYTGQYEWDSESQLYFGTCKEDKFILTFQGESLEEVKEEFKNSVENYEEFLDKLNSRSLRSE